MLKPGANLEMLVASDEEEEEEVPKLQLLDDQQESSIESSRSVTPDVWVRGAAPSQLLFSTNNQEMTKISGRKDAFSNVASDDAMEFNFFPPKSSFVNKIQQHTLLLTLKLQKIIEKNVMKMPKC